ncbi:MAG: carbohydrate ABC transporter permease [Caldilineaceae bacterium SB0675_bin_29]|uniref:Carbohydrate ABC transporter permease n=1 Tax=Caldilineaceae bacterium SB0675_bin_29 TaxID=2605266 RepID=A0A6B1G9Y0_9CHLR|nr:carbohydrate ABC transporter permease [Caldilineaceae bacterium]MCY3990558.1 carbohydrate ABC transporter permease [Caldilineaceae bacterium]MYH62884.1 carbohydrate ABC transporter permease [Caldilineaceae bacterium SB0675_bin_29]
MARTLSDPGGGAKEQNRLLLVATKRSFTIIVYALLIALAFSMIFPYLWMLANSFKSRTDFFTNPYSVIPMPPTLSTYYDALTIGRMGVYLGNSILYAAAVLVVQLFIDSLAAYSFARVDFPGREALFLAVLATLMLPGSVTLIPTFLIAHGLGLTNTFTGVVLPGFAGAFGIFLLRQFFLNIPRELEDAARIDGSGFFGTYWRIMLPLAKPAMVTLGVFIFLNEWSSFVWPLIILSDWKKYPVTVGIALFRDVNQINWPAVFAGSTIVSFPIVILFVLAQEYIIGGISLSGLKG